MSLGITTGPDIFSERASDRYPSSPTANPWGSAKSGKYVGVLFERSRAVLEWMQSDALQTQARLALAVAEVRVIL